MFVDTLHQSHILLQLNNVNKRVDPGQHILIWIELRIFWTPKTNWKMTI